MSPDTSSRAAPGRHAHPVLIAIPMASRPAFFAMLLLALILLLSPIAMLVSLWQDRVDHARAELAGFIPTRHAFETLRHIQNHRGLSLRLAAGDPTTRQSVERMSGLIDQDLSDLSGSFHAAGWGDDPALGQALALWERIKSPLARKDDIGILQSHTMLSSAVIQSIQAISQRSSALMDDAPSSHFFIQAIDTLYPIALEQIAFARGAGAIALASPGFDDHIRMRSAIAMHELQRTSDAISRDLAQGALLSPELAAQIAEALDQQNSAVSTFANAIQSSIVDKNEPMSATAFFDLGNAALESMYSNIDKRVIPWTQGLVEARVAKLRASQAALILLGLALAAAMLLNVSALRKASGSLISMKRSKDQVEELLGGIVTERTAELTDMILSLQAAQEENVRKAKLAALGSMVAGVAHEINTPIGNILLSQSAFHDEAMAAADAAHSGSLKKSDLLRFLDHSLHSSHIAIDACERAAKLVRSFKQVAADQAHETPRGFELAEVVADLARSFMPTLMSSTPRPALQIAPGPSLHCFACPGLIEQILTILLQNCASHAFIGRESGTIRIHMDSEPIGAPPDATTATITVSDDGVGMSEEVLRHAFDPFFSTTHGVGGTGIGLSIARQLALSLGGELHAQSTLAQGSVFTLRFPQARPAL